MITEYAYYMGTAMLFAPIFLALVLAAVGK